MVTSQVGFCRYRHRRRVTIGQIASYVPGGAAASGTATVGKNVPRRRGARRDCDRVSKAEDVPEYKGSLPVEELLAFVEGSVPSSGGSRLSTDTKLRRTKRKEAGDGDVKLRNGDSKLVEVDVPVPPHLACLPHAQPLNGLLNGSSAHSPKLDLPVKISFDSYVDDSEWLSSDLASRLMANEDRNGDIVERKEKEFVLVQKKRRPKISAAVNDDDDAQSVKPLNGFCLGKNGTGNSIHGDTEEYSGYVNGFHVEEILETNGVSRNSSEGSLAQSFSSDMDDLSHFIGEDGHGGGELYVDAPLCWNNAADEDDDKEDSLSSFCSTMSSAESRQRLSSPTSQKVASPDIDDVDVFPQDRLHSPSMNEPVDSISTPAEHDSLAEIHTVQRLHSISVLCASDDDSFSRCTRLCCVVPYKHVKHQTPIVFCDSRLERTRDDDDDDDVSGIVFSFGCVLSDHLVAGGLCIESAGSQVSSDAECELCLGEAPCDGNVSFIYSDSVPQSTSSSIPYSTEPLPSSVRTCHDDTRSAVDSNEYFQVHDIQSFLFTSKCYFFIR